jgi:Holliday junction resolvase RusA-like endonuclease
MNGSIMIPVAREVKNKMSGHRSTHIFFTVPFLPVSVNHYKLPAAKGGFYQTREAKAFKEAVAVLGRPLVAMLKADIEFYEVEYTLWFARENFLRSDVDNAAKLILDGLKVAGLVRDDRYIVDLHCYKRQAESPRDERTMIRVWASDWVRP